MRKIFIILVILCTLPAFSKTITGGVKQENSGSNTIYDAHSGKPIEGVIIKIPSKHYKTKTDKNGTFELNTNITAPAIMQAEKNGYKPFSITLDKETALSPISAGIEKSTPHDIAVETGMIHIGDDSFSKNSANADDFCLSSKGVFYSKDCSIKKLSPEEELYISIGSIIGIDTIEAQRMGQSHTITSYSSAPELFFNGNKIAEIKINGDNQKIKIPGQLIKENQRNNITIKTGRNMTKTSAVDYDDIEFANLLLEIK